jgi:DNA-binding NarL/FixJ family response regulator
MHRVTILLVDDHVGFLQAAARTLREEPGLEVVGQALSGKEAIAAVERLSPDVVLLDWHMPVMDGPAVLRIVKQMVPRPLVVMLTGSNGSIYRKVAQKMGADGFILKDAFATELPNLIGRLVMERRAGLQAK